MDGDLNPDETTPTEGTPAASPSFGTKVNGRFTCVRRWPDVDALWERIRTGGKAWYLYSLDIPPPAAATTDPEALAAYTGMLDEKLARERRRDPSCALVFADTPADPTMVKIYNPRTTGGCGCGDTAPLPGWIVSLDPPIDLVAQREGQACTVPDDKKDGTGSSWWGLKKASA